MIEPLVELHIPQNKSKTPKNIIDNAPPLVQIGINLLSQSYSNLMGPPTGKKFKSKRPTTLDLESL